MIDDKFMTVSEVAELLGVTVQRTHQLIAQFDIPTVVVHARLKLVHKEDAERLAKTPRPTGVHRPVPEKKSP